MFADWSANPPKNHYPTDVFIHSAGGQGGQDFHFVVVAMLTTDKVKAERTAEEIKHWMTLTAGRKPTEKHMPKDYTVPRG
jgi:hypothetical protein